MINQYLERNGVRLHIADTELLLSHGWSREFIAEKCYNVGNGIYVTNRISMGLMGQFVIGDSFPFDYAMPGQYVDGHVWAYDEQAPIFGRLYNLRANFHVLVQTMLKEAHLI